MTNSLSQQTVSYPNVDVRALAQAVKNIARLAMLRTPHLESIEENAIRAGAYARDLDQAIRTALSRLGTALRDKSDAGYVNALAQLDEAIASLPPGDGSRPVLEAERAKVLARLAEGNRRLVDAFATEAEQLNARMLDLRRVPIAERVKSVLDEQQQQLARVQQEMAEAEQRREKLLAERATIIESLNLLRGQNAFDIINEWIPSGSDIDKLDLTNPKKEILKQALDITKKLLGKLSDALKYVDLTEARDLLDKRIDAVSDELDTMRSKADAANQLLNGLNDALKLADEREVLLKQAGTVQGAWGAFASHVKSLLDEGGDARSISAALKDQSDFLDDLSKQYSLVILT